MSDKENGEVSAYHWKKFSFTKSPKNWTEYDIRLKSDGIEICSPSSSDFIRFEDIRTLQLYKPNPKSFAFRIETCNKKQSFEFSDLFATGFNSYTVHTNAFEKIIIAINRQCIRHNPKVRYILGDHVYIIIMSIYRVAIPILAVVLLLFGIGMLIKKGHPAVLSFGISLAILYLAEKKNTFMKQQPYDPHLLIKSGLKALPLKPKIRS